MICVPQHHRLIIIGSGPAGCTAAIYAARANLLPAIITGNIRGGRVTSAQDIDDWPADPEGVDGMKLAHRLMQHAERFASIVLEDVICSVDLMSRPFSLCSHERNYTCDALVIATGTLPKHLGLSTEAEFIGRGVSYSLEDSYLYQDQDVCVAGDGTAAIRAAIHLMDIAKTVHLVLSSKLIDEDSSHFGKMVHGTRAGRLIIHRCSVVDAFLGDARGVTSVRLRTENAGEQELSVKACFVVQGYRPNVQLFEGHLHTSNGFIVTGYRREAYTTMTSIPGVFAAGDVQDPLYGRAITSAASGCMAAIDAQRFLAAADH